MKTIVLTSLLFVGSCSLFGGNNPIVREVAKTVPGGSLAVSVVAKATQAEPAPIGLADWREKVDDCADEESDNFARALDITDIVEIKRRCEVILDVPCWARTEGCPSYPKN